jgi:hypothetical protein
VECVSASVCAFIQWVLLLFVYGALVLITEFTYIHTFIPEGVADSEILRDTHILPICHHLHQPINVPTAGAFLMDHI